LFDEFWAAVNGLGPHLFPDREDSTLVGPDVPDVSRSREPTPTIHQKCFSMLFIYFNTKNPKCKQTIYTFLPNEDNKVMPIKYHQAITTNRT
jgi:hypothetical protein